MILNVLGLSFNALSEGKRGRHKGLPFLQQAGRHVQIYIFIILQCLMPVL